eukprot:scaffold5658_cov115-Pinguiococcus_pyrenoidosus.AAC.1
MSSWAWRYRRVCASRSGTSWAKEPRFFPCISRFSLLLASSRSEERQLASLKSPLRHPRHMLPDSPSSRIKPKATSGTQPPVRSF